MEVTGSQEALVGGEVVLPTSSGDSVRKPFTVCTTCGLLALVCGIAYLNPMAILFGLIGLFVAFTMGPIAYKLEPEELTVRRAWWNGSRVPYEDIERIVPIFPYGDFNRPAAMHMVIYNGQKIYLCAKDQPQLLAELLTRARHMKQYGYEWRREVVFDSLSE